MLFMIPRSPRWLVKQNRVADARAVLATIGEENLDAQVQEMVTR